jgi:hypothetical protein
MKYDLLVTELDLKYSPKTLMNRLYQRGYFRCIACPVKHRPTGAVSLQSAKASVPAQLPETPKSHPKTRLLEARTSHFLSQFTRCTPIMARISRLIEEHTSSNYYYFPHLTKQDYDRAFNDARSWALETLLRAPELPPESSTSRRK